jgi:hypothetical protein
MTMKQQGLTPELIFEPDGHVTDVCLTCIADGEIDIVPQAALDHLDACDPCGARLGEAALLSVAAREALTELAPVAVAAPAALVPAEGAPITPRRARRPLPIAAIAAALLIAAVTAGPALADTIAGVPALAAAVLAWMPTLMRVARALLWEGPSVLGPWALAIKGVSAAMFVLAGLQVARVTSRRRAMAVEGGEQ